MRIHKKNSHSAFENRKFFQFFHIFNKFSQQPQNMLIFVENCRDVTFSNWLLTLMLPLISGYDNVQMRLCDLCNAECTRNPKISAKKCRDSGAKNLQNRRRKRKNFVSKTFLCIPNAAHGHTKTSKASKWDLLACKTPNARARRILRGKLQRF